MSNQILDDFTPLPKSSYAKKSFRQFLLALFLYFLSFFLIISFSSKQNEPEWLSPFIGFLALMGSTIAIGGLINGIKSFRRKEPSNKKYIGTIGSLFFVTLLVAIFVALIIDIYPYIKA